MPTNDERRKIAAELRENRDPLTPYNLVDYIFDDPWNHDSGEEVAARLADLIEPEERTCRNTVGKPFVGYRMFSCSECGAYLEVDGDTDANLFAGGERPMPRYCPNCGAKVVQE